MFLPGTARSLRTKRSYNIQVVVENITNPFFAELFETMRRALEGYGYTAILRPLDKPFSCEDFDGADGVAACFLEERPGSGRSAGRRGSVQSSASIGSGFRRSVPACGRRCRRAWRWRRRI